MEQSAKEAWKRLLEEARRELSDATVRTWLEPAVPIALDDDRLIVGAPDQFAVEWNEQKHASVLARAAERVFARPTDRKSTRLNSSPVRISYAVLRLQKKKPRT